MCTVLLVHCCGRCWRTWALDYSEGKKKNMSSKRVHRASLVVILLILLSVCSAAGGKQLAEEKVQKDYSTAASSREGPATAAAGDHPSMVKTNDYGRYDPAPAFSRPRFKLIPN